MTQSNKADQPKDDIKAAVRDASKGAARAGEDLRDGGSDAARHAGDAAEKAAARAREAATTGQNSATAGSSSGATAGSSSGGIGAGGSPSAGRGEAGGSGMVGGIDTQQAKQMLQERQQQLEKLVRERPLASLAGAFAVGYIIAKLR